MPISVYKIQTVPDRKILEVMQRLGQQYFGSDTNLAVSVIGVYPPFQVPVGAELNIIFTDTSRLIDSVEIRKQNYYVKYKRGGESLSPTYDEIKIDINPNGGVWLTQDSQLSFFMDLCGVFPPLEVDEDREFGENLLAIESGIHGRILSRLESTATTLIEDVVKHKEKIEDEFNKKTAQLEERVQSAVALKTEELNAWESKLKEKQKTIDDSDNTFARRKLRDQMLLDVKSRIESFGVSRSTEMKRLPIRLAYYFMLFFIIVTVGVFGYEAFMHAPNVSRSELALSGVLGLGGKSGVNVNAFDSVDQTIFYVLLVKLTISIFGFFVVAIYYIKWESRWADQHAANEFQLQQFYLDISRANWVVETGLEWKKETGEAMPELLLGNISGKLFALHGDEGDKAINPADELASALLGSSSKLKLKMGENEMEFNKPAKIKSTVSSSGE